MKPLGRMQWAGILLAGGSVVLTLLSLAWLDAQSSIASPTPLKWLLLAGIAGLLGVGRDSTWITTIVPDRSERPMQRAVKRFAEQHRRDGTLRHMRSRRR